MCGILDYKYDMIVEYIRFNTLDITLKPYMVYISYGLAVKLAVVKINIILNILDKTMIY